MMLCRWNSRKYSRRWLQQRAFFPGVIQQVMAKNTGVAAHFYLPSINSSMNFNIFSVLWTWRYIWTHMFRATYIFHHHHRWTSMGTPHGATGGFGLQCRLTQITAAESYLSFPVTYGSVSETLIKCKEPFQNLESGLSILTSWVFGLPRSPVWGWDRGPHKCAPLRSRGWRRSSSC